jgi:hypothetical protein
MPAQKKQLFGPLRPWVAPAFGAGLVVSGVAVVAGVASKYGPAIGIGVALVILLIGHWRVTRGSERPPSQSRQSRQSRRWPKR